MYMNYYQKCYKIGFQIVRKRNIKKTEVVFKLRKKFNLTL